MKLRRVINGQKRVTDLGAWKSGEKMPKTAFPLRASGFRLPGAFTWRIVRFQCGEEAYRLLMAYRIDLSKAVFYLGREVNTELLVMCRYEFHQTEPGWHMHCLCDDAGKPVGRLACEDKRVPHWESFHRDLEFGISCAEDAWKRAERVFRLAKEPPYELEGQAWQT